MVKRLAAQSEKKRRRLFVSLKGPARGVRMTAAGMRSLFRHHRRISQTAPAHPHRFRHYAEFRTMPRKLSTHATTAVLLLSFPDNPLSSAITQASVQDVFFGSGLATLNGYYNENSFGQISFAGSVFGPFTLYANYDCSQTDAMEAAAIGAADPVVDLTQYSGLSREPQ